jgi:hypothetical protein
LNSGWNIATALQESEQRWQNAMMIRKLQNALPVQRRLE